MKPKLESTYITVENIFKIEHIGSTAVPGLISKPILDMMNFKTLTNFR